MADAPKRSRKVKQIDVSDPVSDTPVKAARPPLTKEPTPQKKPPTRKIVASPEDKLPKEVVVKKIEDAKSLAELIKNMASANEPKSDKQAIKLTKDTLKLVADAQKSGSLAFKRESTKTLVHIRAAVDKMNFSKDADKKKLITDIDTAVLDSKNVTHYMTSVAKTQANSIKEQAAAETKLIKLKATNEARQHKNNAKAEAKAIVNKAALEHKALMDKGEQDLKINRTDHLLKVKARRIDLADREKKLDDDTKLRSIQHQQTVDDHNIKKKKDRSESAAQVRKIKSDLIVRRKDQDANHKKKVAEVADLHAKSKVELKLIKDEAKAKVESIHEEMKNKKEANKSARRNERTKKFLGNITEGIHDANPLLGLAVNMIGGLKDAHGTYKEHRENKKGTKKDVHLKKIDKALGGSKISKKGGLPINVGGSTGGKAAAPAAGKAGTMAPVAAEGGWLAGIMEMIPSVVGIVSSIGSFIGTIAGFAGKLGPLIGKGARAIPVIGLVVTAVMTIWDFVEGFNNAAKLFGDNDLNPSLFKKTFSGFVNVFSSLIGIVDTVAGWFGFDTKLHERFEKGAVSVYNAVTGFFTTFGGMISDWWKNFDLSKTLSSTGDMILAGAKLVLESMLVPFRDLADKFATVMTKLPGIDEKSSAVKALREFGSGGKPVDNISSGTVAKADSIKDKQATVDTLEDDIDSKRQKAGNTTVMSDNSVKSSNTTYVAQKMSSRNDDRRVSNYGSAAFGGT